MVGYMELHVLSAQLFCKSKIVLRKLLIIFKIVDQLKTIRMRDWWQNVLPEV